MAASSGLRFVTIVQTMALASRRTRLPMSQLVSHRSEQILDRDDARHGDRDSGHDKCGEQAPYEPGPETAP